MASISKQSNGRRTVQFSAADGKRKSIRLGKVSQSDALTIKLKVEKLVSASITGHTYDDETSRWVKGLEKRLADKLAKAGLIEPPDASTLKAFVDAYIESRSDVKPATKQTYNHGRRTLLAFFGPEKLIRDITEGDAEDFRRFLLDQDLAENSVRLRCRVAKQFFKSAVRRRLISSNPFEVLTGLVSGSNQSRQYFITRTEAKKVINACPDAEWRLLFALSRYGGLRCPSEHLMLRWEDVNWEHDRITIHSPKTEHHEGGESRIIPIFPELRPHLQEVWDLAEDGAEYVITRYRDRNSNLRTQLNRIIKKAGLKPWPKLFHNLRSTRETELAEQFPMHTVCSWIGNSQLIAAKHYLQVTEEHFEKALHNPVQHPAVSGGMEWKSSPNADRESPTKQRAATKCSPMQNQNVGLTGIEPALR
jgi:integrase